MSVGCVIMYTVLCFTIFSFTLISTNEGPTFDSVYTTASDFVSISQTAGFIDKTMLLKDILDGLGPTFRIMVTAPGKFGKTASLSMVKKFLSIPVNYEGNLRNANHTRAHAAFRKRAVYRDGAFFYKHFASCPVLHLDLKMVEEQAITCYREAFTVLKGRIHDAFVQHMYLRLSGKLSEEQKDVCGRWISETDYANSTDQQVLSGLENLGRFLFAHFDRKVTVLVDEYDSIIRSAMRFVADVDDFSNIVRLVVGTVAELFRADGHVQNGIVTGVLTIGLPELDKFQVCKFSEDHALVGFCGFREDQVHDLFKNPLFRHRFTAEKVRKAGIWYNGYETGNGVKIYSPLSFLRYLNRIVIDTYWMEPGGDLRSLLVRNPVLEQIKTLLTFQTISVPIYDSLQLEHLLELRRVYYNRRAIPRDDVLFSHFVERGYVKVVSDREGSGPTPRNSTLRLPNYEIWNFVLNEVSTAFKHNEKTLQTILAAIHRGFNKTFGPISDLAEQVGRKHNVSFAV